LIPYLKQQHKGWKPLNPGGHDGTEVRALNTKEDYLSFWRELEAKYAGKSEK
jgi:hypothetical protein